VAAATKRDTVREAEALTTELGGQVGVLITHTKKEHKKKGRCRAIKIMCGSSNSKRETD